MERVMKIEKNRNYYCDVGVFFDVVSYLLLCRAGGTDYGKGMGG